MVLDQIFKTGWICKKENAFILALLFTFVGILCARLIFPSSIGMMSVAFVSILLVPSLNTLTKKELFKHPKTASKMPFLSLHRLYHVHKDLIKVYAFIFLGIFFGYSVIALLLPPQLLISFFTPQLKAANIVGFAISSNALKDIILNNLIVFMVCLFLSLIYGAGAVIFLSWNASVWGIVFGFLSKEASSAVGTGPISYFISSFLPFFPHMATEALAYICAAIAGIIVSKAVLQENLMTSRFNAVIKDAMLIFISGLALVIIAGYIEVCL